MRIMNDENSDNDAGATIMANMKMSFRRWARLEIIMTTPKALQNRSATALPSQFLAWGFAAYTSVKTELNIKRKI